MLFIHFCSSVQLRFFPTFYVVLKSQYSSKGRLDAGLVGVDLVDGSQNARFVLAGRITDPCRAATHQRDRLASVGVLEPVQHHDRQQVADVERRAGAIVSDVGDELAIRCQRIDATLVRGLMDEAARMQRVEEVGFHCRHWGRRVDGLRKRP